MFHSQAFRPGKAIEVSIPSGIWGAAAPTRMIR
jgi:hypothetical protein